MENDPDIKAIKKVGENAKQNALERVNKDLRSEIASMKNVDNETVNKYNNDKKSFVNDVKKKAIKDGKNSLNTDTQIWLFNADTKSNVLIGKDSFKHGAARMDATYIGVCQNISEILKNAVAVNELTAREDTNGGTVFLSMAEDSNNYVIVRFVVENRTQKLTDYDVLYAISKKA